MSDQIDISLGVDIDPSVKKAVAELEKMRKAEKAFATEVLKSGKVTDKAAKEMRRRNSEIKKQELALDKTGQAWRDLAGDTNQAAKAQQRLQVEVEETNEAFDRASRATALAGDVQSNIGATRGLLQAGGLEGLAGGLDIGGELIVLAEELPRLKTSLKGLPSAAASASEVLGLGGLAGSLQVVAPGLSATAAGALALAIPLAVIAAALAAVSLASTQYADRLNDAKEAQDRLNAVLLQGVTTANEIKELRRIGDDEALVAARNNAFAVRAELAQQAQVLNQQLEEQRKQLEDAGLALPGNLARDEIVATMESLEGAIDDLLEPTSLAAANLDLFDAAIAELSESELEAAIHTKDLAKANDDAAKAEQERVTTLSKLTALEQQANAALESFSRRRSQQAEDTALERTFELEDEQAELQDHYGTLADIRNSGNDKLAEIEAKLTDLPLERTNAIAEATKKSNDSLDKINSDFFNKQITSLDKFRLGEQRVNERYQKTLRRTLDSLRDSLSDAEASNDVNAFLAAQRDGTKQLKELAEDQTDDARDRLEDFVSQRNAEMQAHTDKLAEINSTLALEKQAISEAFLERRTELAATLELEKAAIQERLQNQRDSFAQAQQREDQQEQRAEQRLAIRTAREDAALQRQLAAINQKTQAELNATAQVTSAMLSLAARVQTVASRGGSFGKSALGQPPHRGRFGGPSPFRSSRGLPSSVGGRGGRGSRADTVFNFNPQVMVGDIASTAQVSEALRINSQDIMGAIVGGMGGRIR